MDKLHSIYFLRGLAALAVVIQHSFNHNASDASKPWWFQLLYGVSNYGYLGVALFFVISGFCIHLRTARGLRDTGDVTIEWRDFWWRRIHRLYPPYLGMLVISMSLWVYVYSQGGANIYPDRGAHWLVLDFISHIFMLHGLHPALDQGAGNPAYWTLAREEYLYLMYAGILIFFSRLYGIRKTTFFIFCVGIASYLISDALIPHTSPWHRLVSLSPLFLWIQWALGALAVEAYFGTVKLPPWCYWLPLVPFWCGLGWVFTNYLPILEPAAWGMAFFTLLNYCVKRETEGRWPDTWQMRSFFALGIFSYSMYLAHPVIAAGVRRLTSTVEISSPFGNLFFDLFLVVCCIVAGKIYYELVEKRFLNTPTTALGPARQSVKNESTNITG